jgi:hypothetical protein
VSAQHTPGPWRDNGPFGFGRHIEGPGGLNIAVSYSGDTPEGVANAALIAAAPAMLAALEAITEHYRALVACGDCGNWDPEAEPVVQRARDAIAKARGA